MEKILLKESKESALYEITEEVPLDEADIFETSFEYNEIIDIEELWGHKVRVKYTSSDPAIKKEELDGNATN